MDIFWMIVCFIASYLLGAISFGYLVGKIIKGVDIRQFGSGNVGATNVFRTLGKGLGILVLFLDMAKGVLAVTAIPWILQKIVQQDLLINIELIKILFGVTAVAGHVWTVFLGFKGGKGVATTVGVFLGLTWLPMLIAMAVFVAVVYLTRYISVGSITMGVTLVIMNLVLHQPKEYTILSAVLALLIIYTHRSNIKRLINGTENKFGAKKNKS